MSRISKILEHTERFGAVFLPGREREAIAGAERALATGVSRVMVREEVDMGFRAASWIISGRQVIEVTPDLAAALASTEALPAGDILPFPAFAITLPDSPIEIPADRGRSFAARVLVVSAGLDRDNGPAYAVDALTDTEVTLRVSRSFAAPDHEEHEPWASPDMEALGVSPDRATCIAIARIVHNLSLFISEGVERLPAPQMKKLRGTKSWIRRMRVGSTISLPSAIRDHVRNECSGDPLYKIGRRFIVRGHWRNQACGPERTERKKIWVRPHWKGPDTADEMRRLYKAETLTEAGIAH